MIDKNLLTGFVESNLEGTRYFPVDITVTPDNIIRVEIASPEGVDLDECIALSRAIEAEFPRDDEDYELEVGSAGLTSPFKVLRQYTMNIGQRVELLTADGKKLKGSLTAADEEGFTVEIPVKVKKEGEKRPVTENVAHRFAFGEVKWTRLDF